MALVEMVMPKMGESIMEGTVLKWLKQVGDTIEQDESVLEVATDKVDTEVPATHAGVLKEILAQEGDVVEVGKPIAIISTGGDDNAAAPAATGAAAPAAAPQTQAAPAAAQTATATASAKLDAPVSGRFYSPLVLNIARQENISMQELEYVPGTGSEGRVTKKDIMSYLNSRGQQQAAPAQVNGAAQPQQAAAQPAAAPAPQPQAAPAPAAASAPSQSYSGNVEIIEMDRMRKMISQRMVDSKRISPHVTSFVEADMTSIVNWRNKHKDA
ncbi:MAG: E3 binding domain-containing protein, partial [Hymenobacteraceae bacterium]|nr:E3 binding domain-containing protein [Hymenobacteraceae bacterium]MDX5395882.1 E3 binding domain-containing protein [Hymenobacteraceae bacterium]MDX5511937.1 E3 binding domain-containing protein [Hymenobacteraceae bacterium]